LRGVRRGREVEAVNFGVSGYGTAQELITLRDKVFDYEPDIVLLAFTTNNDVTDNSRALKRTDEIPYFLMREGALVRTTPSARRAPFVCVTPRSTARAAGSGTTPASCSSRINHTAR
jgi:hypothetical protein